jgi:nucleotide-binding universal stress UspA family protein
MLTPQYIIVGTDFSPCAQNAVEYAAAFSNVLGATLVLVHAYKVSGKAGALTSIERHIRISAMEEITGSLVEIKAMYPDLKIEETTRKGEAKDVLLWAASKYEAFIVIAGTQGVHEDPEVFVGSTTGALIKLGNAPVLAVPRKCMFTPFAKILFAVKNPHVASVEVLEPFLALREHFRSKVTLLHITQDSSPDLSRFPSPYPIEPHTDIVQISDGDNIYHSVQDYLLNQEADLLVAISRLRGFFEGLFSHSSTSASTFNSELPILVLHGGVRE